ncbi:helix-turn-helix domain-containing protein [Puniceibacterium sediminis]|uniref:Transcriptional regulator, AraC family n=1 Tax=Puniceibacterium sediminis TaxID=1608407 RepID=A0A238Y4M1_9RHOB|nr:AraC family transcriptional regulator [Puniceibacterium sediminis]SNR66145.1 transcriptional regulator, AraC family [Puniceibacterium sediminis]
MPVLPIPMIIALLLSGFLLHRALTRETHPALLVLIGCCAAQSAVIALVQYYGLTGLRIVQPLLATVIPAVSWLAFRQASVGYLGRHDHLHLLGPVAAVVCLAISPEALDVLIPALFAGYGIAIAVALLRGEDSLPHSRLENGRMTVLVWRVLAVALVASAGTDIFIAIRLASGHANVLLWLPSLFSSVTLLVLGALGLSHAIDSQSTSPDARTEYSVQDKNRDTAIVEKLATYLEAHKPYLDPDLTLARLARKLQVPEKQVSSAINKAQGENVSRYINRHRIHHACALMQDGKSVTEAMLASGFNTKSNFNREFLRVMGASPRLWLKSAVEVQ